MSNARKICSVLIAADEPLSMPEIAKQAGVGAGACATALYSLVEAHVVEKTGERLAYRYAVANVDEAKRRASGETMRSRPRKAKAAKPPKEAPPAKRAKRRKAVKRRARAEPKGDDGDFLFSIDNDGDLNIVDRTANDATLAMPRAWALKLAWFLVRQQHLLTGKEPRA